MDISFSERALPDAGTVVVFSMADRTLLPAAQELDEALGGAISKAVGATRFEGKSSQVLEILAPHGTGIDRVIVAGLGKASEIEPISGEAVGGTVCARLLVSGAEAVTFVAELPAETSVDGAAFAVALGTGVLLRSYRFDKYRTKEPAEKKPSLTAITIATADHKAAAGKFEQVEKVTRGVFFTRDLVSEPPNVLYPRSFAKEIEKLTADGLDVEVLGEAEMEKLGMHALVGVGLGSAQESQLAIMRWNGSPKNDDPPIAFVGKGVTFDTGGISLKPGEGMWDMKWDMGGAGIVAGTMKALALRKAKANVIGVVGLVENMPSGTAQRPSDVVTSMSGQTIEVLNTDAEGRLVLADALWYTQDRFSPRVMIDLATLTGAMIVALGWNQFAGYFTDDDELAAALEQAGKSSGDGVWRLPLSREYDELIDTPVADVKNIGGRWAGSITAAQFLKRFTNKATWAHIDVAGMAWGQKDHPLYEKGATGYGVRLLDRLVAENYEAGD
jgi:leucyl aminopeptidase